MSKATLRNAVIGLTAFTGVVHLVILNLGGLDVLFLLNGLAYFILLAAFLGYIKPVADQQRLIHIAFMLFAAVTIVMFFLFHGSGTLGYVTKAVEVLLVLALAMHMNK